MKIYRQISILLALMERGGSTALELAQNLEVSPRTIRRDVEELSQAGIPVYTAQGMGGGIRLASGFTLQRAVFNEAERSLLVGTLRNLSSTQDIGAGSALKKLGALFGDVGGEEWFRIDLGGWGHRHQGVLFDTLRDGIRNRRLVRMQYLGQDGRWEGRTVEPMTLLYRGSAWYVWGWCRLRGAFRLFRLSRIRNCELLQQTFERRGGSLDEEHSAPPGPEIPALRLRFEPRARRRVYEEFTPEEIMENADGTMDVSVRFPADEWVEGLILSFGTAAAVVSPEWLRARIARIAGDIQKKYNGFNEPDNHLSCYCSYNGNKNTGGTPMENQTYCQSCAMPLNPDVLATNKDGSRNPDYCMYCMKDGEFTSNQTMEEMIETCVPFVSNGNPWADAETARKEMKTIFPNLKRWKDERHD